MIEGKISDSNNAPRYHDLKDKRVIISGGAMGIGAAFVEAFAWQGAAVAFTDIAKSESHNLVESLEDVAIKPAFFHCDITEQSQFKDTLHNMTDTLGGCDILINNAANDQRHSPADIDHKEWDDSFAVNVKHHFFASQAVTPHMRRAGGGSIINLGSISWHIALKNLVLYQMAKAAVEGLTRSLARELGPDNIRVNTIVPGNVQTPRQQQWYNPEAEAQLVANQCLKARIQPEDIAAMALFLASQNARYCTGHNYWVDAGWR